MHLNKLLLLEVTHLSCLILHLYWYYNKKLCIIIDSLWRLHINYIKHSFDHFMNYYSINHAAQCILVFCAIVRSNCLITLLSSQ